MALISKIDVTYLPITTPETMLDDIDLNTLNQAYQYCIEYKARSFCTYPSLIPFIESKNYITPLCAVVDFPDGTETPEYKIRQAAQAYEICKKSSSSELDIVLNPCLSMAIEDLLCLEIAKFYKDIKIKYILELGVRPNDEIEEILRFFDPLTVGTSLIHTNYIKTNTGRKNKPSFNEKIKQVEWLRSKTDLPMKIAGGISSWNEIEAYEREISGEKIYGVSFDKIKDW